jgi:hypothetical protein
MGNQRYSEEFRKLAVEKLLCRGSRPVASIIEELGISSPTLYQWRNDFASISGMKNNCDIFLEKLRHCWALIGFWSTGPGFYTMCRIFF